MSNTERNSPVIDCPPATEHHPGRIDSYPPKEVNLGEDGLKVRRTLPNMSRSFVGAWCFVDHYGPEEGACMDVAPHPHTSLQTVSWLFSGEIEHRDSGDVHAMVRPGEMNLMTSGYGISHSEVSTASRAALHGVQLWVVLPEESADLTREFQHFVPTLDDNHSGVQSRVFVGNLGDASSPVHTETPLLGAEVILAPGATWETGVDAGFEHGVLVDTGHVDFDGVRLDNSVLGVGDAGLDTCACTTPPTPPHDSCAWGANRSTRHCHVVELHRPQPRRHRPPAQGVERGAGGPLRTGEGVPRCRGSARSPTAARRAQAEAAFPLGTGEVDRFIW